MAPEDAHILDAAITVVTRYGMKRTTMADIAYATGVSRQTLYDRFGDKDGIMAAAIGMIAERVCTELRASFATEADLATNLDTYFRVAIWPTYEMMQMMPDAADFERGLATASIAAVRRVGEAKQAILVDVLRSHLPPRGPTPEQVSRFFEQSSCQAKMSGMAREDLEQYLSVLKESMLALTSRP
jgi:AcrR family transcriptional regulator